MQIQTLCLRGGDSHSGPAPLNFRLRLAAVTAAAVLLSGCVTLSCPAPIVNVVAPEGSSTSTGAMSSWGAPAAGAQPNFLEPKPSRQLVANLTFAAGESDITPDSLGAIREVASSIRKGRVVPTSIVVAGFTDDKGTSEHRLRIATLRVQAVRELLERMGVDPAMIVLDPRVNENQVEPCGEMITGRRGPTKTTRAAQLERLEDCRRPNRRVQITVDGISGNLY